MDISVEVLFVLGRWLTLGRTALQEEEGWTDPRRRLCLRFQAAEVWRGLKISETSAWRTRDTECYQRRLCSVCLFVTGQVSLETPWDRTPGTRPEQRLSRGHRTDVPARDEKQPTRLFSFLPPELLHFHKHRKSTVSLLCYTITSEAVWDKVAAQGQR